MVPFVSQMLQGNQEIVSSAFPAIESDKAKEKGIQVKLTFRTENAVQCRSQLS